jgi:hypothetical protein
VSENAPHKGIACEDYDNLVLVQSMNLGLAPVEPNGEWVNVRAQTAEARLRTAKETERTLQDLLKSQRNNWLTEKDRANYAGAQVAQLRSDLSLVSEMSNRMQAQRDHLRSVIADYEDIQSVTMLQAQVAQQAEEIKRLAEFEWAYKELSK